MKTLKWMPVVAGLLGAGMAMAAQTTDKPSSPGSTASSETRNWADVDTNKDNLVSPEEMEAYLQRQSGTKK